jgi:ribosome-associated heat shock protein Hsp15
LSDSIRIDKWLWFARFFKTRTLAAEIAIRGRMRLNTAHVSKASQNIKPGDVLTFPQGRVVRVIRVVACGVRRGPANEAQQLYEDLDPPKMAPSPPSDSREAGAVEELRSRGRPTKKDRRAIDRLKGEEVRKSK